VRPRRRYELRTPVGAVTCGECGTAHQAAACPCCGEQPEGVLVGVLQTEVTTEGGARWLVTAQRDPESGGWEPVVRQPSVSPWAGGIGEASR
jgi:hypothetical protein